MNTAVDDDGSSELENFNVDQQEIITEEEQLRLKEREEILNRAVRGEMHDMRDRVAFILNRSVETRNSDIDLAWTYWTTFESEKFSGRTMSKEQMKAVARISSLTRWRAKIQNDYKLFQADDLVKKFRGTLNDEQRDQAVAEKPTGIGQYSVYIDETGKTQNYLSVGSLWELNIDAVADTKAALALKNWKKQQEIEYEFHFTDLTKNKMEQYKAFFLKFLTLLPGIGFKLIVLHNKGFKDQNATITDLTFHLLSKGVEDENTTGRAPLPRYLQVWLDEEEKGSDQLKIENIRERLKGQKVEGLYLSDFEAASSKGNFHLQAVDLFTSSVNRKLHFPEGANFKDEFADFVLQVIGLDIQTINKQNESVDNAKVFDLSKFQLSQ